MQIGVPAVGIHLRVRERYAGGGDLPTAGTRSGITVPKDDLNQPWVPDSRSEVQRLLSQRWWTTIANDAERPHWKPGSSAWSPR